MRRLALLFFWLTSFSVDAKPLDVFRDCAACPEMIELPMGEFMMGAPADEFRRNLVWRDGAHHRATPEHPHVKTDEGPQHHVTVDIRIAMGRNEVTYDEWMACVNDGGCNGYIPRDFIYMNSDGLRYDVTGNHPVLFVSYFDALSFADWLNQKVGADVYRLPTEAEWEYAARAGTTTRFAQGDDISAEEANFDGEMSEMVLIEERPDFVTLRHPVPVDMLDAANSWGLRHMSGNVTEITSSCYTETYAGWSSTSQWLNESRQSSCQRTVRGGDYFSPIDILRVAWRGQTDETFRVKPGGFRILREVEGAY